MIVLAMDLSLSSPAFAILAKNAKEEKPQLLHLSSVRTNPKRSHGFRLKQIYDHLEQVLRTEDIEIDAVVSEKGFSRHARTTQILFMVHGVARLGCFVKGYEVEEMSPTTVKKIVAGNGKASKEQLADSVRGYFDEELTFKNDDESDAVSVGVAYFIEKGK
ncbi:MULTISPECIES: crossover junction endodeoxyribonuclease RuvC [unclassified Exiguobacterium]|uniref:crossover junction endodeoxyribonuclease RuvC n=1 Tax=unclassified Exiguobacterium TaxID=2644629 RepID=UPI001BE67B12|nr:MULTISPECIES: crossover junction endodeoxyribonuclease RuvC [unclassified Exiguobacterium]